METQAILRLGLGPAGILGSARHGHGVPEGSGQAWPNPDDWTDTAGAAEIIGRSRPNVYELVEKGTLTRYQLGAHGMFWVPECREVGAAIERLSGGRRG